MADTSITKLKQVNVIGTTADTFTLSEACKQLVIINSHATQTLHVKISSGDTAAAALAGISGTAPVATIQTGTYKIAAAGGRKVVAKSGRARFYCIYAIGSGASTTFDVEGTDWFD